MNDIHFFWHSFLFSFSLFLVKPLYVTHIDVDGNIYFGFDADVFIDIKICAAVVLCLYFDFVDNASALNAFVLCSFGSVEV